MSLIVIAAAGLVLGPRAARGEILGQLAGVVGSAAADAIQQMLQSAAKPTAGILATIIGSSFGAAGSIIVVLVWVYWSALIFLFGAEFTHMYSMVGDTGADGDSPGPQRTIAPKSEDGRFWTSFDTPLSAPATRQFNDFLVRSRLVGVSHQE